MWTALASLGMSLIGGAASRSAQRAQNMVLDAQAAAENIIREGKNTEAAGFDALDKWMTSENNRRAARAGGEAFNAAQQTLARTQDAYTKGSIEDQLAASEAAGAYAANSAFSGTAGASTDVIAYTIKAQQERRALYAQQNQKYTTYDTMSQIAGITSQTLEGLQVVGGAAGLDKGISLSKAKPVSGSWLSDTLQWALSNTKGAQQIAEGVGGFFNSGSVKYQLGSGTDSSLGLKQGGSYGLQPTKSGFWAM